MTLLDRLRNLVRGRVGEQRVYVGLRQAGVNVTEDTALAYSAVHACVRLISETMAAMPWQVYRRLASGRESMPKHAVQWLLNTQASPEQTAFVHRRTLLAHHLLWGNGFSEIERDNAGRPIWLWPLLPDRSRIARSETGALVCLVRQDGVEYVLPRENVIHLSDGSFDGITGMSRIQLARRSIGVGMAQDTFAAAYYQNGAALGGVIEHQGRTLTAEARDVLLQTFNEKYAGPDRAHKTLYLDGGMEYKSLALPLADAQFLETRRYQVEDVARWYGVPLHLLQDLSDANYAISYESSRNFVEHTLRPIAVLLEQEANIRLFGQRAQGTIYSRINLAGLMRADPKTRGEYYRALVNAGVMSINEIRELEEMNSIGPDGDEHYLQVNMTTAARIREGDTAAAPAEPPAGNGGDPPQNVIAGNFPRYPNGEQALQWQRERR